jgi:deazaflavin-dependent oxidoreductase (nitroreductase family)
MSMTNNDPPYVAPDLALIGDTHIARYEETEGTVGHEWNGATCLVLTTKGRRTGQPRKFALIYDRDGDNYLVIASKGGAPTHPGWYLNVVANPEVRVQVLGERFPARARTATAAEKPRLWKIMTQRWPNYDVYTTRTDRDIPLVVLEPLPAGEAGDPSLTQGQSR